MTIGDWKVSLEIFACHLERGNAAHVFDAQHDVVYGPSVPDPESKDGLKLIDMGWYWDSMLECWGKFT